MRTQVQLAEQFRALHRADAPLILANVWDPLSAAIVADAGFPAVATASAAVALSRGFDDGEEIPFDELVELVDRICRTVRVPVSVDLERGYGSSADEVRDNAMALLAVGAVGVNLEDSIDDKSLRPIDEQRARLEAVRDAGRERGVALFVNARTDVFMLGGNEEEGLARLQAYADAGADGVYPIMCTDPAILQRISAASNRPINVLLTPSIPSLESLTAVGVKRLSMGPGLLSVSAGATRDALRRLAAGDLRLDGDAQFSSAEMRRVQGIQV